MNGRVMVLAGLLTGIAMATPAVASPLRLTDSQLDGITAGTATVTVWDSSGTALGIAVAYNFASAQQYGPLQVAVGDGTAVAVGLSPTSSVGVSGSGNVVFIKTFQGSAPIVSFSSGLGLAVSFGK